MSTFKYTAAMFTAALTSVIMTASSLMIYLSLGTGA